MEGEIRVGALYGSCAVWKDAKDINFRLQNQHVQNLRVTTKITEIECITPKTSRIKHGKKEAQSMKKPGKAKKKQRKSTEKYMRNTSKFIRNHSN